MSNAVRSISGALGGVGGSVASAFSNILKVPKPVPVALDAPTQDIADPSIAAGLAADKAATATRDAEIERQKRGRASTISAGSDSAYADQQARGALAQKKRNSASSELLGG